METLIVQSGIKHGRIAELTRANGERLSIGRSYDNDLVLTDIHVAPRQVAFFRDEAGWHMQVLDTTNPVFLNDRKVGGDTTPLVHCGDTVTVGRTRLSLYSAQRSVEKTRKLRLANWLSRDSGNGFLPVLVLLVFALADFGLTFAESSTSLNWGEPAYGQLMAVVIAVLWAGIWALVGRIIRHQPHFGLQLMAAASVMLLTTVLVLGAEYLAYPFHSVRVSELFAWGASFLLFALLFYLNLTIATQLLNARAVAIAMSALIITVLYAFTEFGNSEDEQMALWPEYSTTLAPPVLPLPRGASADDYFARLRQQVDTLAEGR
ncbi:MAG: FHA domain-containing protein [Halioglobus sp.]|nr:FHA domain-containing protein [Halioglobus sp.]